MKRRIIAIVSFLLVATIAMGASAIGFGNMILCNDGAGLSRPVLTDECLSSSLDYTSTQSPQDDIPCVGTNKNIKVNSQNKSCGTRFLNALFEALELFTASEKLNTQTSAPSTTAPAVSTVPATPPPATSAPQTQITTSPPMTTIPQTTAPQTTAPATLPPPVTTSSATSTTAATTKPQTTTPPPATTTTTTSSLSFEQQVAELVNVERAKAGLAPLTLDIALSDVARLKSQDMADNKYFDHNSPTYGSPFEMMRQFGISYRCAGENIAYGYTTPASVMKAWMNSPGHKANILNPNYTKIGVGYTTPGHYCTQMFIG